MKLQKKQAPLLILTLVALGFLGYQITALIRDDIATPAPQPAASAQTAAHTVAAAPASNTPPAPTQNAANHNANPPAQATNANATPRVHTSLAGLNTTPNATTEDQKAYLQMVNRYEVAQMEHKLLNEELAIARAQHDIAMISQETHRFTQDDTSFGATTGTTQNAANAGITLAYLGQQTGGHWAATLAMNGTFQDVTAGSHLKDGTVVRRINEQGVELQNGSQRYMLTFDGKIQWETPAADTPSLYPTPVSIEPPAHATPSVTPAVTPAPTAVPQAVTPLVPTAESANKPATITPHMTPPLPPVIKQQAAALQPQVPAKPHFTVDELALLQAAPQHFTLLLQTGDSLDALTHYAKTAGLDDEAFYYTHHTAHNTTYQLVYGDFETKTDAQETLKELPKAIREHAQLVALSDVQKQIKG
ncbi:MAG: hypothetical protein A3J38_04890 [Gammaproteobacteria bacterium RIFCSPHIGHO2_12_FULL_45_9]|nr:MAG: hypothetical protein A3J38_04890 [Gammaproteobacteria bacterium RIFCSPHIGHO2_12_FULL_45_9]